MEAPTLRGMRKLKEKYPGAINVVEEDGLVMFTYTYANSDLFTEKWGKEARGITFDLKTGSIISRPFHKFFNSGEPAAPKEFHPQVRTEKLDGSLLQVSWDTERDQLFVASRSTLRKNSSYVINAFYKLPEEIRKKIEDFAREFYTFTHLFELLDPNNQIVIFYPELQATYLLSRGKRSGEYSYLAPDGIDAVVWEPVKHYTVEDIVREAQTARDMEGWVLFDPELQDFVKIKTPWYLERHKVTELNLPEHYVAAWAEDSLDDYLSFANLLGGKGEKAKRIQRVMNMLNAVFETFMESEEVQKANSLRKLPNRKDAALSLKEFLEDSEFGGIIFSAAMQSYGKDDADFMQKLQELYRKNASKSNSQLRKMLVEETAKVLRS